MSIDDILADITKVTMLVAIVVAVYRYKSLDKVSKIYLFLISVDLVNEYVARYIAIKYQNNLPIYNIYSLIELSIICWYFNESIDVFRKRHIGFIIAGTSVILGICNFIFLQPISIMNSYFLMYEGTCIIALSLFSFFRLLLNHDGLRLHRYPRFWLTAILLFYWSITYVTWGLASFLLAEIRYVWINVFVSSVNIITYICTMLVYLLYNKMQAADE